MLSQPIRGLNALLFLYSAILWVKGLHVLESGGCDQTFPLFDDTFQLCYLKARLPCLDEILRNFRSCLRDLSSGLECFPR